MGRDVTCSNEDGQVKFTTNVRKNDVTEYT